MSIRDMALIGAEGVAGTIGILAAGGDVNVASSSLFFQFSNLKFAGLDKGIYVNSLDPPTPTDSNGHKWQCDNVRLDQCTFAEETVKSE